MFEADIREKRIRINSVMGRNALIEFDIDSTYMLNDYSGLVLTAHYFILTGVT